ncbi:MAG TPA: hypothetical protein VMT12_03290, partial [Syntrophales bacterium]|nr:hypothetical protein [Syntrophales bacterium]
IIINTFVILDLNDCVVITFLSFRASEARLEPAPYLIRGIQYFIVKPLHNHLLCHFDRREKS